MKWNNYEEVKKSNFIFNINILYISFFFFYPHHYKLEYEIDNFNIIEEYHKKAKYYSFKIKYEDNTMKLSTKVNTPTKEN